MCLSLCAALAFFVKIMYHLLLLNYSLNNLLAYSDVCVAPKEAV